MEAEIAELQRVGHGLVAGWLGGWPVAAQDRHLHFSVRRTSTWQPGMPPWRPIRSKARTARHTGCQSGRPWLLPAWPPPHLPCGTRPFQPNPYPIARSCSALQGALASQRLVLTPHDLSHATPASTLQRPCRLTRASTRHPSSPGRAVPACARRPGAAAGCRPLGAGAVADGLCAGAGGGGAAAGHAGGGAGHGGAAQVGRALGGLQGFSGQGGLCWSCWWRWGKQWSYTGPMEAAAGHAGGIAARRAQCSCNGGICVFTGSIPLP